MGGVAGAGGVLRVNTSVLARLATLAVDPCG